MSNGGVYVPGVNVAGYMNALLTDADDTWRSVFFDSGAWHIYGGGGDDVIIGSPTNGQLDDFLVGWDGNDFLKNGADMRGYFGDDRIEIDYELLFGAGLTCLDGGPGYDSLIVRADSATNGVGQLGNFVTVSFQYFAGLSGAIVTGFQELVIIASSANETIFSAVGDNEASTIYGGAGNDTISVTSTTASRTSYGEDGDDIIFTSLGEDTVFGGDGNDQIYDWTPFFNGGNDDLNGGNGDDRFFLNASETLSTRDSQLDGNDGSDAIILSFESFGQGVNTDLSVFMDAVIKDFTGYSFASIERWTFRLSAFDDSFTGNGGTNDGIFGYAGNDILRGLGGNDQIQGGIGNDQLYGGAGVDFLFGEDGNDRIFGDSENDILAGGSGNDILLGGEGADQIAGDVDDDLLNGGAGADDLNGGSGFDTASYADDAAGVIFNLDTATRDGVASRRALDGSGSTDTLTFIESAIGSDFDDRLWGNFLRNTLEGGDGNDSLYGRGGNDRLIGGLGDDLLNGASGVDIADYSAESVTIVADLTLGTASGATIGTDTLVSIETVYGGSADDTFTGADRNETFFGNAGMDTANGGLGNDTLRGGDDDDTLNGNEGSDRLYGDDGDDKINGGDGVDVIDGGLGNDIINGEADGDRIFGRDGDDTINGGSGIDIINAQEGNDTLFGGDDRDFLRGNDGNDTISGDGGNDRIDGGADTDTVVYAGNQADYNIILRANGVLSVEDLNTTDGDEGFDVITNAEFLQFADGIVDISGL